MQTSPMELQHKEDTHWSDNSFVLYSELEKQTRKMPMTNGQISMKFSLVAPSKQTFFSFRP